jgi:hypothetical protein
MLRPLPSGSIYLILVLLLSGSLLFGQRDLGTITGNITDATGAAVVNAKVTIANDATGVVSETTTTGTGSFTRPALNPGTYTVTVEAPGFQKAVQKNIVIVPNQPVSVDMSLQVGNSSQTVEVTASAPLLQTESPVIGENLNSAQLTDLPLGGQRTFTFLARMSPGVVPAENGARDALGGGFSANGVRSTGENNFLLNGVDNNVNVIDFINQTAFVIGPSVEAIGDMQVITNGANAEYGRAAGGILNVSLKSGTNEVHGVLFEILQNTDLDANRWENNLAGKDRNPFKQNQFGAAAGAPIIKNKLFIFGDYQGTRISTAGGSIQNLGYGGFYTVPSAAERTGDFSALLGAQVGTAYNASGSVIPVYQNELFDPTSTKCISGCVAGTLSAAAGQTPVYGRNPFSSGGKLNAIPSAMFDPVAAKLTAMYPATNASSSNCGVAGSGCYYTANPGSLNQDQGDGRVDWHYNDKNSIFGTMSWSDTVKTSVPPFGGAIDGGGFYGSGETDLGRNAMISWTHIFSPTIVNEARVGFSRLVTSRVQGNANADVYSAVGIGGYDPTNAAALNGGLPQFGLGRYSQIGGADWLPTQEYNNEWDLIENLSITKGNHTFKMGGEFRELHFPFFQVPYPHGEMNFARVETGIDTTAGATLSNTGDEFASFLLGAIDNGQISTTNFVSSTKQGYATYFQDNWKFTSKLTLNLGVRYELFSPIGEQFGRQSSFDLQNLTLYIPKGNNSDAPLPPNFNAPATINGVTFPALFKTPITISRNQVNKYIIPWDKADIGPRLGFAYNIVPKTVIRGFYGIFYGGEENQGGNPNRGESAPFNESPSLNRPAGVSSFQPDPLLGNGQPTGAISVGYPVNVFTGAPLSSLQFRSVAEDFRNPMVQEWNFAVQQELPGQMALELGYEGNHQSHQLLQPDPNACPTVFTTNSAVSCNSLRLYPDIGSISGTATFGYGNYEAMTASLVKRTTNGLQYQLAYTYGHALANSGTTLSGSSGLYNPNGLDYSQAYTTASWDIRHNFVGSFNYELPFGRGKQFGGNMNKAVQTVLGNWQVNGILSLRTGQPITLRSNACLKVAEDGNACGPTLATGNANDEPDGGRRASEWFNTANFVPIASLTTDQRLNIGNVGLNSNVGPPTRTLDFSIFKNFNFTERMFVQFRAEGTNVANTPQFNAPDTNQQDANFGKITATQAGSERHIQFALRFQF